MPENTRVWVLGYEVTGRPVRAQFAVCAAGMLASFAAYGVLLEAIFVRLAPEVAAATGGAVGKPSLGAFVTLCQFAGNCGLASLQRVVEGRRTHHDDLMLGGSGGGGLLRTGASSSAATGRAPLGRFAGVAVFSVLAIGLANVSLAFLNYPTQMIFKSCKLVPVAVGGRLLLGRRFTQAEQLSVGLLVTASLLMTWGNVRVAPNFDPVGVFLLLGSLFADAFTTNLQEKTFRLYPRTTPQEMLQYTYGFAALLLGVGLLVTGVFVPAIRAVWHSPAAAAAIAGFVAAGFVGSSFSIAMVKLFSAFASATTATCRKVLSIVLSFILFDKPFSWAYAGAVLLSVAGAGAQVHSKHPDVLQGLVNKSRWARRRIAAATRTTNTTPPSAVGGMMGGAGGVGGVGPVGAVGPVGGVGATGSGVGATGSGVMPVAARDPLAHAQQRYDAAWLGQGGPAWAAAPTTQSIRVM